jgi:hypothetical protein
VTCCALIEVTIAPSAWVRIMVGIVANVLVSCHRRTGVRKGYEIRWDY